MIDEPLASHWRYDLGQRKIFELRSSLGLSGEGPAPSSAVFAYGVVPGLARVLTHPEVAAHRTDLRLARVETVFASELDMRDSLICAIDVGVGRSVVATISCEDTYGASAVATVHLTPDADYSPPEPLTSPDVSHQLHIDPARCVAFAAATWDLNPAYWDRELAEAVGLGGPVAPPGLPFALAIEALERNCGRHAAAVDVYFDRTARPGDVLDLRYKGGPRDLSFEAESSEGLVLHGRAVLGHDEVPL